MLSLVSGHYPTGPGQVAVTDGVAATFGLKVGDVWHQGGKARRVTGIVENPQSLLDEFALVAPGQVTAPTQVVVLFNAPGVKASSIGPTVESRASVAASNPFNPETIVLGLATIGMLLIALVAIGGFTVLAQRGCARWACSAPWAPRTRTSVSSSGPTGSRWELSAPCSAPSSGWPRGWRTGRASRPAPTT